MKFNQETIATLGQQATGSVLLASETIITPIEYFDLTLPAGYAAFRLQLNDFVCSVMDYPAMAVSADRGSTFACDNTHYDTYSETGSLTVGLPRDNTGSSFWAGNDALLALSHAADPASGVGINSVVEFTPGSTTSLFQALVRAGSFGQFDNGPSCFRYISWQSAMNPAANTPPMPARANLIRVQPEGYGDCDPPTSGETFIGGSYFLWGIPMP